MIVWGGYNGSYLATGGRYCAAPAPTCAPSPPGIVSWWPGDGNANDIVGGNNGTLVGGVTFAAGEVGQAFGFNGSDYAEAAASSSLNVPQITIEAWINASTPGVGGFPRILSWSGFALEIADYANAGS